MVAVGKRSAGDRSATPVNGVDRRLAIALSVPLTELSSELTRQVLDEFIRLFVDRFVGVDNTLMIDLNLLGLGDEPRTFHPRPGAQPCESSLNVAGHCQPLDRGIDPAFDRNVGRCHVGGFAACVSISGQLCLGVAMREHEWRQQKHR